MARPREFDPEKAIDKAVQVFWQRGYRGTSIQDLVDAMGIQRGSLYAAYGSKAGVFAAAMDRYMSAVSARRLLENSADRPIREVLADIFAEIVEVAVRDRRRRGCMITNTAVELSPHEKQVAAKIAGNLNEFEGLLAGRLADAQRKGEVRRDRSPRAMARFLVACLQGLRVMAKVRPERGALQDIADGALASLD